ncbi:hypothetical protein KAR91_76675 [Candidatus Pacearchaeota archaeon]|nr:hypothetical protein [Candidatus Pacearchaeota archaeon]
MIAYFAYSQELDSLSAMQPVSHRELLINIEGNITEEKKAIARALIDPIQVEEARAVLEGLGFPYHIRMVFNGHPTETCEAENL